MNVVICKTCKYCEQRGRQQTQQNTVNRKRYYCTHFYLEGKKDKYNLPVNTFIGFGFMGIESPLAIKTQPRWCPLKHCKLCVYVNDCELDNSYTNDKCLDGIRRGLEDTKHK